MKNLFPFLFVVCAAAQISGEITLKKCILRIAQEKLTLQLETERIQHAVWDTLIPSGQNYLLNLTSNLKNDINQGPNNCWLWTDYVNSIEENEISDENYKMCKMQFVFDRLADYDKEWAYLADSVNTIWLTCHEPGADCTQFINKLWNRIIFIHDNTQIMFNYILTESSTCVLMKKENITNSIASVRSSWETCANAN